MRIRFEPNDKSREEDAAKVLIEIDGILYRPSHWSENGFLAEGAFSAEDVGREYAARLDGGDSDGAIPLECRVRLAGFEDGKADFVFCGKAPRIFGNNQARDEQHNQQRVTMPQPSEGASRLGAADAKPKIRSKIKTGAYYFVLTAAALALGWYAFWRLSTIKIPDAMLVSNYVQIGVTEPVQITKIAVHEGQAVLPGDVMFETDGGAAVAEVKSAERRLATTMAEKDTTMGQIEEENAQVALFSDVTHLRIGRQKAAIQKTQAALERARRVLDRTKSLFQLKTATREDLNTAQDDFGIASGQVDEDQADLNLMRLNERSAMEGRYFDGRIVQGRVNKLKQGLKLIDARIAQAAQDLENAKHRLRNVSVTAPCPGSVYAIYHRPGELINATTTVLSIDTHDGFCVLGTLRPDEAYLVRPGAPVDLEIPNTGVRARGHIEAIGRRAVAATAEGGAFAEVSAAVIPCRAVFDKTPANLTSGVRVVMDIHLKPLGRLSYR